MDAPRIGGAERYSGDLCGGLAAAGLEVHAIMPDDDIVLPYMRKRVGDRVLIHPIGRRPSFDLRFASNLARAVLPVSQVRAALRRIRPDLVHVSNGGFPGSHICRAAALVARQPCVMTVNCRAQPRRLGAHAPHDRLMWHSLNRVITPARATAESLVERRGAPADLLRVVPYGIEEPRAEAAQIRRLRERLAPEGELLVGMVAAPSNNEDIVNKGHDIFLDALAAARRDDVRGAVVGHDPGREWRARADAMGLGARVELIAGFHDVAPYMHAFDVLAVPSTENEALPLVILEAMASGTPALASRLSGIPEAVVHGETGHTFAAGDAAALGALIVRCAQDRGKLRRLGEAARQRWRSRYSLELMVAGTVAVYEECVHNGRDT